MAMFSFVIAANSNPGYTKSLTLLNTVEGENCHICEAAKPARTHHCSKCQNCVYAMDHHCIWIDNCVGVNNRKAFTLLLFWGGFGLIIAGIGGVCVSVDLVSLIVFHSTLFTAKMILEYITLIFILLAIGFNGIAMVFYSIYNFVNILKDVNMIEKFFSYNITWKKRSPKNNFYFYFGRNPLFWLIPLGVPNVQRNPDDYEEDGI